MVDYNEIAIADVLRHPGCGIISHQPRMHDLIEDRIRVADVKGNVFHVLASECDENVTLEEVREYWREFNILLEKEGRER